MDDVLELGESLARLHTELASVMQERARLNREVDRLRCEIAAVNRRVDIVTGKRGGGRPLGSTSVMSLQSRVHNLLLEDRSRVWTPKEIAKSLNEFVEPIRLRLAQLADLDRIRRIRRGVYQAWPLGEGPPLPMLQYASHEKLFEQIRESIATTPYSAWTAKRLVAEGLARTIQHAYRIFENLRALGAAKRIGRGVYVHPDCTDVVPQPRLSKAARSRAGQPRRNARHPVCTRSELLNTLLYRPRGSKA